MFSDKFRFIKIFVLILTLSGLVYYAQTQGPENIPGFKEFKINPAQFVDKEIGFQGKIIKIEDKSFIVEQILENEKINLTIEGMLLKAKPKDTIYGVAIYRADKTLTINRYIISNSRPAKILISLIAFLIVTFLFLRDFTFDFKKIMFKEKYA